MYNEVRIVYKGEIAPLYLQTNKNIDSDKLKLLKYEENENEWVDLEVTFNNVVDNFYKTEYKFEELGIVLLKITYDDNEITNSIINVVDNILSKLYDYTFGNWEIKDNKMYFYDLNGEIIATYKLLDQAGNPTELAIAKREKI